VDSVYGRSHWMQALRTPFRWNGPAANRVPASSSFCRSMSLSKVTGLYERNLQKSWVPGKKLGGICKEDTFLENNRKEFAREPSSWRKAGRNSQKSPLPGKETEGICKRTAYLEKRGMGFSREPASWKISHLFSQFL